MALSTPNLYPVILNDEQRARLLDLTRNGLAPAKMIRHPHVLLLSDGQRPQGRLTRDQIAQQLGMHVNTVDRIRKRFVREGEQPALNRKTRATPPVPAKIDGSVEAHRIALCCGKAPEGRTRWTLRLLANELKRRGLVAQVCVETVRQALKKTNCNLGGSNAGAFPNETPPASLPRWRKSSTSTSRRTPPRIGKAEELEEEVEKWTAERNREGCCVQWRFTTNEARVKLRHLYPHF